MYVRYQPEHFSVVQISVDACQIFVVWKKSAFILNDILILANAKILCQDISKADFLQSLFTPQKNNIYINITYINYSSKLIIYINIYTMLCIIIIKIIETNLICVYSFLVQDTRCNLTRFIFKKKRAWSFILSYLFYYNLISCFFGTIKIN